MMKIYIYLYVKMCKTQSCDAMLCRCLNVVYNLLVVTEVHSFCDTLSTTAIIIMQFSLVSFMCILNNITSSFVGDYEYRVIVTPVTVGLNMTTRPDDGSIYYEIQLISSDGQILTSTFILPVSIVERDIHRCIGTKCVKTCRYYFYTFSADVSHFHSESRNH